MSGIEAAIRIEIKEQETEVVSWRRYLHQHPELSFQEKETAFFIERKLQEFGFNVQTGIGGYGLVAELKGDQAGPTIAFRADFDALPIHDEKEVSYRSQKAGVMHACGHDGHTAALLGFAKVLIKYKDQIKGNILFIFQPAEEIPPGGAKAMLEQGILKDVDYVFAAHLGSDLPTGKLSIGSGYKMAAVDKFTITIKGSGGHGARPQDTNDPIVIGSDLVNSLQKVVSRRVDPLKAAVVTIGLFQAGHSFNVIPDQAKLEGTVRSFDANVRKLVEQQIRTIVNGIAEAYQAEIIIDYLNGYPALYNDPELTAQITAIFNQQFRDQVIDFEPMMGAEDFSYFLQEKPGTYFRVGSQKDTATAYPHHHPMFDFDEQALTQIQEAFLEIARAYVFKA
ncbi:M20 metallopeptidase family protein [Amphibacillus sediminis]|uniref:M20 metallopeptidase family protein n=1 Tax=Amphibacillus sediminis TaxID=360185 RepID=UPI0008322920|nr:amidohydrolase [Amphibacillus sediminis]